ncbi:uncharacterized protein B0P05DRAFT_359499 [Gilbertella persicaria]|uniref:uncharacterized protein n=1 Tax=Gilbertella persicaria TaxID=101096 RepID=UPI00221EAF87|nr:uncharacterized protein B0P05DRAFT_359499 [Gilbertella persicaria]KAI8047685.1 hypothetical protein B0P05DRAFT_359499 [Gilbertella persicaria]
MWESNPAFQEEIEKIPEELRLIHCANILESSPGFADNTEALNYLRSRASANGDTEAKTKLSILFGSENKLPHLTSNPAEASFWSRSIFDKQLSHALQLCAPTLRTTDELSTLDFIKTMTESNDRESQEIHLCYLAGLLYTKGIGFSQDLDRGIHMLKHAAGQGRFAEAGCELGRIYGDRYKYSLNQPAEAMHWFHRAFECGSTQAVVDLAYGFFEGSEDVPKDDEKAMRYAKDGALLNDKYCQYIVGHLYLKGRGVEKDAQEAVKWLHASAQQGFAVALEEEAMVYMYGDGNVKQDYEKAYQCCMQPTAASIPFCQARLGDMYRNSWGVTQDYHKAFGYYQNAASQADAPFPYAQHMLGEMFLYGEGVPQDMAVAKEWFQIASTQGYEPSQIKLQHIEALESSSVLQQKRQQEEKTTTSEPVQEKRSSRWSLNFFNNNKKK